MSNIKPAFSQLTSATYHIRVAGRLDEHWAKYFDCTLLYVEEEDDQPVSTLLEGYFVDQSALLGVINGLSGLGLALISVRCLAVPDIKVETKPK